MINKPNWSGANQEVRQRIERALDINSSSGYPELLQTFINRTVQMLSLREFGLFTMLPKKAGQGDKEYINQRTSASGGAWVTDVATASDATGTYAQINFPYKTLLTKGVVSRKLQAVGRTYADTLALELQAKVEDFTAAIEDALVIGNTAGAAAEPNGFITMIQGSQQGVATAAQNVHNMSTNLSLAKLDEAIDLVKGSSVRSDLMIVGSFAGIRMLNTVLQANQRFNDVVEVGAGFRVRTYDGIPLVVSTGVPNDLTVQNSAGALHGQILDLTGGSTTALLILNKRYNYLAELTPTTVLPLAKTTSQSDEFEMYWDGHPVCANTLGAAMLVGLTL